jgi:ribosomal protein S18 acetylase RimI-like enzyme
MLYEAATWRGEPRPSIEEVLARPEISVYLDAWGRAGDTALIAEDESGKRLGAAWYRLFTADAHGYGFIDSSVPELTVSVRGAVRGRGVGTALLLALIDQAADEGLNELSLSVEKDNPALRLYERLGFKPAADPGDTVTMRLSLGGLDETDTESSESR